MSLHVLLKQMFRVVGEKPDRLILQGGDVFGVEIDGEFELVGGGKYQTDEYKFEQFKKFPNGAIPTFSSELYRAKLRVWISDKDLYEKKKFKNESDKFIADEVYAELHPEQKETVSDLIKLGINIFRKLMRIGNYHDARNHYDQIKQLYTPWIGQFSRAESASFNFPEEEYAIALRSPIYYYTDLAYIRKQEKKSNVRSLTLERKKLIRGLHENAGNNPIETYETALKPFASPSTITANCFTLPTSFSNRHSRNSRRNATFTPRSGM
jgi:hypothetical protein